LALLCEHAGILVRLAIRYCRWSSLVLLTLLCGLALVIFFLKGLFSLATRRLLISRGELRLELFPGVAEALCFFADLSLDAFATGLGDFFGFGDGEECASLCSDSSCRLFLRHRLAHRGAFQGLRQKRTQL